MQVYISESAFWGLLVSAIEVYTKESYGLLLGHNLENMFIVEHAIACQKAERHSTWVKAKDKSYRKIVEFLKNLPNLYIIGDFHSHPRAAPVLSDEDIDDMRKGEISIIVEIRDKAKDQFWRYNEDGTLAGSTENFFLKIAAFYLDNDRKPKQADILCPFAIGFDIKDRNPVE